MTVAVCLNCGEFKHGAFNPCSKCHHTPNSPDDQARHLLVTDHYLERAQLEQVSTKIKAGEKPAFNESQVEEIARTIPELKMPAKHAFAMFVILGVILLIPIAIVFLIFWLFGK